MSNGHVQNWCKRKGMRFEELPQYFSKGSLPWRTTTMHEGIKIVANINNKVGFLQPLFTIMGDPSNPALKKCQHCHNL